MRILLGAAIGGFAVLAYQDPSIIEPAQAQVLDILNGIGAFIVEKTG